MQFHFPFALSFSHFSSLFVIFVLQKSAFLLAILGTSRKAFVGIFGFMRVESENKSLGKITASGGYSGSVG
jgi:hypothetical protein